ncbi:hypothetical protein Droror1_Dr00027629 [Drosera rotundifolia]
MNPELVVQGSRSRREPGLILFERQFQFGGPREDGESQSRSRVPETDSLLSAGIGEAATGGFEVGSVRRPAQTGTSSANRREK